MMDESEITLEQQCEVVMSTLFRGIQQRGQTLTEDNIKDIQDLLLKAGKSTWSARPRTYAVLRIINRLDSMDIFVNKGLLDLNFPYKIGRIPLELKPQSARKGFFEKQALVLTDIRKAECRSHALLSVDATPHFTILKPLGRGGQGSVEMVRSRLSLKDYARKTMLRSRKFEGSGDAETEFGNELRNLKRLSHRHLVEYVGSYTDPRVFAILLLPVADTDLRTYLSQVPFPENEMTNLREYFGCITSAITYLHRSAIRHKDITPRNILIKGHKIFVTDFGLSLDWSELSKSKTAGQRGKVTRDYVAPEVWDESGQRGSTSDLWPLGCVFLDMVTVLKGRTLQEKTSFFQASGSMARNPRENYEAYLLWMKELRKIEPNRDALPLSWTEHLITVDADARGAADDLLDSITTCFDEEDGHIYHCISCEDVDDGAEFSIVDVPFGSDSDSGENAAGEEKEAGTPRMSVESLDWGLRQSVSRGDQKDVLLWLRRWSKRADQSTEILSCAALHLAAMDGKTSIAQDLISHGFDVNTQINGSTPLHEATQNGHIETMGLLLQQDADPNIRNPQKETALFIAVNRRLAPSVVRLLLDKGAEVNAANWANQTALHRAALRSNAKVVRILLMQPNIDLDIRATDTDATPFVIAVTEASELVFELFIEHGVDVNAASPSKGLTPLHLATMRGDALIIRKLIEGGACVNVRKKVENQASPVHLAAASGNKQALKELLKAEVDTNVRDAMGATALHVAVQQGYSTLVPLLVQRGFDVERRTFDGAPPLTLALIRGHFDTAKVLLDQGADINAQDPQSGGTYLHGAVHRKDERIVDFLLQNGVAVNVQNAGGATALHMAMQQGFSTVIPLLIRRGFDIEKRAFDGARPLGLALVREHFDTAKVLLDQGADINVQDPQGGGTYLHGAVQRKKETIIDFLLQNGAVVDIRNDKLETPLIAAATVGSCGCISRLLKGGADIEARLKDGRTAAMLAVSHGRKDAVELLLDNGADSANLLHVAAGNGHVSIGELLVKRGVSMAAKNEAGKTPLDRAKEGGSKEFVDMMQSLSLA